MEQFRTLGLGDKFAVKIDLRRLGALAVLTLGSCLVWSALTAVGQVQIAPSYASSFRSPTNQEFSAISIDDNDARRRVYPYSVIPGGVESAADLRNSVARDPIVAKHYKDFDVERARVVRLTEPRALYVSYRLGNGVFWTKKPLMLPRGETVISDGEHIARTRCGNRVSEVAAGPVLAAQPEFEAGPPEEAEALGGAPVPSSELGPPIEVSLTPSPMSGLPSTPGGPVAPGGGGGVIIPPIIPVPGGGGSTPPVITPEPEMLLMLSAGLTGVWLWRKKLRS
jgi:hypothetical protein